MKNKNGFALVLSLMFLLVLTLLALVLLLISATYYASARNLHQNEYARLACEQSSRLMVDTHNLELATPRFFHDPLRWNGQNLIPFSWNGYTVSGRLNAAWQSVGPNSFRVVVTKGKYNSRVDLRVVQIRLEDFAFYADAAQTFSTASLIDGRVFVPNGLNLELSTVRFRDYLQGSVAPEAYASFRKTTQQVIPFPQLTAIRTLDDFFQAARTGGLLINSQNPVFWNGVEYELNLDLLVLQPQPFQRWRILYNGTDLGIVSSLHFWFDDAVRIRQTFHETAHLPDTKILQPMYVSSISNVFLDSSVQPIESATHRHPICLAAGGAIQVSSSSPQLVRIHALLIAYGSAVYSGTDSSLIVNPGSASVSSAEITSWKNEIGRSSFLVEPEKKAALLSVLDGGGKIVWFQDTVALAQTISITDDVSEVHFQASKFTYNFLPSFPFVTIVEGSQQWH
ncbi:MAG TPA: hypothetical protein VLH08_11960 [Acidobacteriota bacterium]|nr:hypothetical protein [Acidobacteriota bacterium]